MKSATGLALFVAAVGLAACGGGGGGGDGTCTAGQSFTFTIGGTGLSPRAGCVLPSGSVSYVNETDDPQTVAASGACAGLATAVGANATATISAPGSAINCTFGVSEHADDSRFQGQLAVTTGQVTGPGH